MRFSSNFRGWKVRSGAVSRVGRHRRGHVQLSFDRLEDRIVPYALGGPDSSLNNGSWGWDAGGSGYIDASNGYRGAIQDSTYFGPSGIVPVTITTTNLSTINAGTLSSIDGFISTWWADSDTPSAAVTALVNFFLAGHDLILLNDDSSHDLIAETLGIPTAGGSGGSVSNGGAPLFDGPFGSVTDVDQTGSIGRLDAIDVASHGGHVGATNGGGEITAAYWDRGEYAPGAGRMLVIPDVDMWSSFGTAVYYSLNTNGIFALNCTAFIVSQSVGVSITQSGGSTDVSEAGATDTYTVRLTSAPTGDVTINLNPGGQLRVAPTSLVFTTGNWSNPQTVTVSAVDDTLIEGNHTGVIAHTVTSGDGRYSGLTVPSLTVNITDNDQPRLLLTPATGSLGILEGQTKPYTAGLSGAPSRDVTVTLSPDAQLNVVPTTLVFTPATWSIPQTISVTARDNSIADGNRTVLIHHAVTSGDPFFNGIAAPDMPVAIVDDDVLIIYGTEKADQINVLFSNVQIQVVVNGKASIYPASVGQVLIIPHGGINTVHLFSPTLPITVLGGASTDSVFIDGVSGANAFAIDNSSVTVNGSSVFLFDTEKLTLTGKGGSDTFTALGVPSFAVTLMGSNGLDRLVGPDRTNTWNIAGNDAGTLDGNISFSGVENLTGGARDDVFAFAGGKFISGQVDGGAGSNTLDLSAYKTPITANLQTGTITGTKSFRNISTLFAGTGLDKLIGANATNTWNITAMNTGTVAGLAFRGFENLTGGSLADTFVLGAGQWVRGKIDGGGGNDVLDYGSFATAVTVNLQAKTATNTGGFLNLEQFRGGTGLDALIGGNRVNVWNLTAANAGDVSGSVFSGFENLTGGIAADMFNVASGAGWTGLLDGGFGGDVLTAFTGSTYNLTGPGAGTLNGCSFKGIETRR